MSLKRMRPNDLGPPWQPPYIQKTKDKRIRKNTSKHIKNEQNYPKFYRERMFYMAVISILHE